MKKLSLFIAGFVVLLMMGTGCKKDSSQQAPAVQDVSFSINNVLQQGGLKSTLNDTIVCTNLTPDFVSYKIIGPTGSVFTGTIPVFYIGNIPWTNTIQLPVLTATTQYSVDEFIVYSNNNIPNNPNPIVIWAAPHSSNVFAQYVTTPLDYTFNVASGQKSSVKIDVMCFQPSYYKYFGFTYFKLNQLTVRQQWFFGDFCIKDASQYTSSDYANQPNWVGTGYIDVPAIFKIEVWRGNPAVLQNTFTNDDAAHHYGDKVSVTYGDYANQVDPFIFKLYILVRQGTAFNFVLFNTWTFTDISNISTNTDTHVTEFILGSCYDPAHPPQLILPPYLNLPPTASYSFSAPWGPGTLGGYIDAVLTGIPAGYCISNGTYASNCGDHQTTINAGTNYNMDLYSSLYPTSLPTFVQNQTGKWSKINWLYNHQSMYPNLQWYELQQAIWEYDNVQWDGSTDGGVPALTDPNYPTRALQMVSDANTYGVNYVPPPGGYAAIVFVPHGTQGNATTAAIQTMFIMYDP
jgi:hypothetical protein